MKILVIGFHSVWDLMSHCEQPLRSLGHQTMIFYTNRRGNLAVRLARKLLTLIRGPLDFSQKSKEQMNDHLVSVAQRFRPDLIFAIKGDSLLPETLRRLKALGCPHLVNWATDDPYLYPDIPEGVPFYDAFFICDPSYEPRLKKSGAQQVKFLSFGCNPEVHRPLSLSARDRSRFGSDVCFVGTVYPSRAEILKALLEFELAIWGEPFHQLPEAAGLGQRYRGKAGQEKMVKVYNASHITLNPHHPQNLLGTNMRTFEAAACGIFQLTEKKRYLEETFRLGEELVCYQDPAEVKELVRYYLSHEGERRAIAQRLQEKVLSQHTYRHRMQQMLQGVTG